MPNVVITPGQSFMMNAASAVRDLIVANNADLAGDLSSITVSDPDHETPQDAPAMWSARFEPSTGSHDRSFAFYMMAHFATGPDRLIYFTYVAVAQLGGSIRRFYGSGLRDAQGKIEIHDDHEMKQGDGDTALPTPPPAA